MVFLILSGCAGRTEVANLSLPPVTIIEGIASQIDLHGFTLTDKSGFIVVRAKLPGDKKLNISEHEKVKVYGNLQGGHDKIFAAYVIQKETGEQIIINNPASHFGFIVQTAFQ